MTTISIRNGLWLSRVPVAAALSLLAGALGCSSGPIALGSEGGGGSIGTDGAVGDAATGSDGGTASCCPAGYLVYGCTFPDGGAGTACHDPAKGCPSSLTCGVGCDSVSATCSGSGGSGGASGDAASVDAPPGDAGGASGDGTLGDAGYTEAGGEVSTDAGSALKWWETCGDPVCRDPVDAGPDAGLTDDAGAACPPVGSACTTDGQTCGTHNSAIHCGATEVCSATDPTKRFGGCPVSSRQYKDDIHYVGPAELEQLHEEALAIRLATYNYKGQYDDPTVRHLGFIIEDDPKSPAVDRPYDRVDLYGYVSMVVATMQVQEKEIAALRRELDEARHGVCADAPASSRR